MKKIIFLVLVFSCIAIFGNELFAQCPMCKMAAESDLKAGGTAGRGLNAGILYMLSMPYLLVMGIAFFWWRNRKNAEDNTAQIAENQSFSEN
jgi:hypothetical protein